MEPLEAYLEGAEYMEEMLPWVISLPDTSWTLFLPTPNFSPVSSTG